MRGGWTALMMSFGLVAACGLARADASLAPSSTATRASAAAPQLLAASNSASDAKRRAGARQWGLLSRASEPRSTSTTAAPPGPDQPSDGELARVVEAAGEWAPAPGEVEAALWRAPRTDDDPELPAWIVHDTVPRERIAALALRYDVPESKLRRWNGMSERGRLRWRDPGDIKVRARRQPPPRERLVHLVEPGEDWASVARRYAVRPGHLRSWNRRELGRTLEPGERVRVWIDPIVYAAMLDAPRYEVDGRAALIPAGSHSVGTPQSGRLINAAALPPGPGYEILYPHAAYGTTWTLRHLISALDQFHRRGAYHQDLIIGVISRKRGGRMGGHVSHQSGRDVDIRLPVKRGVRRSQPAQGRRVDWSAAWALARALADSGGVKLILLSYGAQRRLYRQARREGASEALLADLFQYPRPIGSDNGLIRHSPGHKGHFHVRFGCGPHEPECGD